jgi:hypothetical protein
MGTSICRILSPGNVLRDARETRVNFITALANHNTLRHEIISMPCAMPDQSSNHRSRPMSTEGNAYRAAAAPMISLKNRVEPMTGDYRQTPALTMHDVLCEMVIFREPRTASKGSA